jgi:hypothetical protein
VGAGTGAVPAAAEKAKEAKKTTKHTYLDSNRILGNAIPRPSNLLGSGLCHYAVVFGGVVGGVVGVVGQLLWQQQQLKQLKQENKLKKQQNMM